ncbi:alpha-2-macroglobulin family protein [Hansschlegelia zhihuaiae]|uniref:Alpha-2-macroglobulin family protein n=1 Tax=Hansschlegelia zhihuaiae TaxID=405005 RepID=A0A4Q0MJE4_9HYPH|nr:alpha-2-macroglobulin [Hansschlegelia zhihuaiae]RXF73684.1 alpha-2-macroglobulin family protein [Hansschlegelia zhihuaiae]
MAFGWRGFAHGLGAAALAAGLSLAAVAQTPAGGFQNREASESGLKLEARLKREAASDARPVAELIKQGVAQIRASSWREASVTFAVAAGKDPQNEQAWRNLSVALSRVETDDWSEKDSLREQSVGAAWRAYEVSPDAKTKARALAVLANALATRENWRPALDALKASLALADNPDARNTYNSMRAEHGFRALDYSVDSDAASPRACVQFSEDLAKGRVDFSPYVKLKGVEQPAVTAEAQQICVDGLKHGETYELTIREGLPSNVDEPLLASKDFRIYVRDRAPSARFTGRNYVLPSVGQQGVPVVTVNVDAVTVEIFRIGDRSLAQAVTSGDFQKQLDGEALDKLKSDTAATVYSGELVVERRQNADVTTAFPVSEAIPNLAPGVYVMAARPKNATEPEPWDARATQWFVVSDLGLTAVSGADGVKAFARSLANAGPLKDVELRLLARDNEVLATRRTDDQGFATFEPGLVRGTGGQAPAVLVASTGGDYGFLDLTRPGFDLSDRGVGGRAAPGPLDAVVFAERGVYRPNETVHVTALLRDDKGAGVTGLPITLVVKRPDGVEDRRVVSQDAGAGGRTYDIPLVDQAMGGTWRVEALADAKGEPIGEASFLVADYVPEKLDMRVASAATELGAAGATATVDGRWLYGAPAADLALEGEVTVQARAGWLKGFEGYRFGLSDETVAPVRTPLDGLGRTDSKGHANIRIAEPPLPETTRPLEAEVTLRLAEPSGRTLERKITLPVAATGVRIGVKPLFADRVGDGETARFEVRGVGPDGRGVAQAGLGWQLMKLETSYQWYATNGRWNFETVTRARRVADGKLDISADAPGKVEAKVEYGRYRLEVASADPQGPATSVAFDAGYFAAASADTPDTLDVALDKPAYRPGETATVTLGSRFAGRATVLAVAGGVVDQKTLDVSGEGTRLSFPVTEAWRPGAYVVAFVHRPLDAKASRMPGRAVGVAHAQIDAADRTIGVAIDAPEKMEPRRTLDVGLKLTNLAAGEQAYVTLAAVDVGILNLTGYRPPAPDQAVFGQRKLSAEIRDLYGQLIDGMTAARGKLRSGGDGAGAGGLQDAPTQAPLALFSGLVKVGPDGLVSVPFEIPAFNGTVKLMAVAWSGGKLGHAAKDVTVADPVVVTAALPRFLANGDRSRLRLDLDNVTGPAGDYRIEAAASGPLQLADGARTVKLAAKARAAVELPISATGVGQGRVDVRLTGPDGKTLAQALALPAKPQTSPIIRRNVVALAKGASLTVSNDMLLDLVPGAGSVALSVGKPGQLDAASFKLALDGYPYACSEQLSSRLIALIHGDEAGLSSQVADKSADDVRATARDMIARILSRQDSNGSFGLWNAEGGDLWLDAFVTDVFGRARAAGFEVPDRAFALALDNLRNTLGLRNDATESDVAYAHYVLAKNGRALIGDLRYLADVKIEEFASPLARAEIAAALAQTGDFARASRAFAAAEIAPPDDAARTDFGSVLRDQAAIVALASESRAGAALTPAALRRVGSARRDRSYLTTQENAWLLLAARGLKAASADLSLTVEGQPHAGPLDRTFPPERLAAGPATIANAGQTPLEAVVAVTGSPLTPEPPAESGFRLERRYYTTAGVEVDASKVAQNARLVVVLTVTEPEPRPGRVLVVDRLAAGFEIDNPELVTSAKLPALGMLGDEPQAAHSEFRDDRFVAAFDREADGPAVYSAAYVVRAVAPGRSAQPAATVEDMYRADRFARTGAGVVEVTAGR